MEMMYIDVGGTKTRCLLAGDPNAPALLMIHGLALTADIWNKNIDSLSKNHRVIAPDLYGHGFTQPAAGAVVDFHAKLDHIEKFLDVLAVDRLSLCGSSYGSLICSLFYLRNPDRIERLVINGSGSCFNTAEQLQSQVTNLKPVFNLEEMKRSTRAEWRARVGRNFFDSAKIPEDLVLSVQLCYAQKWPLQYLVETLALLGDREAIAPYRILERLEEIKCPTLVLWGRDDHGGKLESAQKAVARMPDARIEVFDKCGHYPMLEYPDRFSDVVQRFLSDPSSVGVASKGSV